MATTSHSKFPARFGKYILLDRINSGGMAEVYRAKVTGVEEFQRLIAIKCMLPALHQDEQFVTMFIDEAKLSAQLSHANIVQIYELGSIDERLYIAMEMINGRDLRHVIKSARKHQVPVPHGFAAYVVAKAAEGLDFAHHKTGLQGEPLNLVHRDVSPQNILVSYDGEVKVVDFGIAKAEERATETRAGVLKGKFAYMAPEQVMGSPLDARADIFALGAVLYECLTGKKLFTGESDLSILDKVRNASVPDFEVVVPNAPSELYDSLRRALTRDPRERFARASDLAESLEPVLIEDRKIFSAKRAKAFMQELYAAEIEDQQQKYREYAKTTLADCEAPPAESPELHTQIFESTFAAEVGPRGTKPMSPQAEEPGPPRMPGGDGGFVHDEPSMPPEETSAPRMPTGDGSLDSERRTTGPTAAFEMPSPGGDFFEAEQTIDEGGMEPLPPTQIGEEYIAEAPTEDMFSAGASADAPPLSVPKSVVIASVIAAAFMLILVIVAIVVPLDSLTGSAAPQTELPPVTTTIEELGVDGKPISVTAAPAAAPGVTVVEEINPDDGNAVAPPPVTGTEPIVTPEPAPANPRDEGTADNSGTTDDDPKKGKGKRGAKKVGYVSVRTIGARSAKVFVNGRFKGKAPLMALKLRTGTHKIKVVEETDKGPGRSRTEKVTVTTKHNRKAPLRLTMPIK